MSKHLLCATLGALAALLSMSVLSCERSRSSGGIVRDSSGIRLVQLSAQDIDQAPVLVLSAEPDIVIGDVDGDSMSVLFRIVDAAAISAGEVAVLLPHEVRVFSRQSGFVRRFGRQGEGPGEFAYASSLAILGDSILVLDEGLQRFSVFTQEGGLVRSFQIAPPMRNPRLAGVLGEGALLLLDDHYSRPERGYEMFYTHVSKHDMEGQRIDSLSLQPLAEFGQLQSVDIITTKTFGALMATAGHPGGYWQVPGPPEVSLRGGDGELRVITRWDGGSLRVSEAAVKQHIDVLVAAAKAEHRARRRSELEETAVANTYPATFRAIASSEGDLWAEEFQPFTSKRPRRWLVFDATGHLRSRVTLPAALEPFEVTRTYVLGKLVDEDGIERVVKYSLSYASN